MARGSEVDRSHTARSTGARSKLTRRLVLLLLLGIVAVAVVVFAFQAARAATALRQAKADASVLQRQVTDGDLVGARRTSVDLRKHARTAHGSSDNLLWDSVSWLPWVGDDVEAVQVISRSLDGVSREALGDGLDLADSVRAGRFRSEGGRFDVAAIRKVAPVLRRDSRATATAAADLDTIEPDGLFSPLAGPARDLQVRFGSLNRALRAASSATQVLPGMLGADGPRRYLLVVQNNAEIRATGGLPGSFAVLRAKDGKVSQGTPVSAADFTELDKPALPLSAGERRLYGDALGEDVRQTNLTPDFPRTGQLLSAIYAKERGERLDGVVSVDPVALSAVLRATGPLKVGAQTFTADNAIGKLLNEPYQRLDTQDAQNAYFSATSQRFFQALLTGKADQQKLVREISASADQRRVVVWSRHAEEQGVISSTAVGGELPRGTLKTPHVGFYLNDNTAAKIEYYLDYTGSLRSLGCRADGSQTLQAGLELRSSVPKDVSGLSEFVTGTGRYAPKGAIQMNLRVYSPVGGSLTGISLDGKPVRVTVGEHDGHQVWVVPLRLAPGARAKVLVYTRTRPGQSGDSVLDLTPGITWRTGQVEARSVCG